MERLYLKTDNLTKRYTQDAGIFNIDIKVKKGEIVGFIGPNGAGKTTFIRSILGLSHFNTGEVDIVGSTKMDRKIWIDVGYLPSEGGVYDLYNPRQLFYYAEKLHNQDFSKNIEKYSKILDLDLDKKIKDLSFGNKKKVGLVLSLLHDPKLLILDEPTEGLDPLMKKTLSIILAERRKEGKSVFLSSHNLQEVEDICDRVYMIKKGKIILEDSTKNIIKNSLNLIKVPNLKKVLQEMIKGVDDVSKTHLHEEEFWIYTKDNKRVIDILVDNHIYDFLIERPTLEEQFLQYFES